MKTKLTLISALCVSLLTGATSKTWPGGATNQTPATYSIPAAGELNWSSLSSFLNALGDSAQSTTFQKHAVRRATTSPVTVSATTDCVIVTALTVPAAVAVTLPAAATKQVFTVVDGTGDAATNNITITPASGLINGASTYVIDKNYAGAVFIYDGTQWTMISEFTAASGSGTTTALTKTNTVTGITNKSFTDSSTLITDNSDATKKIAFEASGITTGTTRTLTVPDVSGTLGLTSDKLSAHAATTSAEFAGVISNETGTGVVVLNDTPTLVTPALGAATGTSLNLSGLTASRALTTDGSKNLASSTVTGTELGYLSGVTTPTGSGALVLANTPTLITPVLGVAGGTSLTLSGLTASRALTTDGSKVLTSSGTSSTELGYVTGVTSAIQTQLDSKFASAGTLGADHGGTGVANNVAATLTRSGNHALTLTTTNTTGVTLPETGTLATLAGSEALTNKSMTSPALTTPNVTTGSYLDMLVQSAVRFNDDSGGDYVAIKAPTGVTTHTLIWPATQGAASTTLTNDGSGNLSWAAAASTTLNQYNTDIGNVSNVRTATNTNLLGDVSASTVSTTVTMTIAAPGVVSHTSHGQISGDRIYFTTTGALPTGVTASTAYFVVYIDANSYSVATTYANAIAGTKITTSGSQSGVHTAVTGGLKMKAPVPNGMVRVDTGNGHGSTNIFIRRFTNQVTTGTAINYADSAGAGGSFTITEAGIYSMSYCDSRGGASGEFGISLNQASTAVLSLTAAEKVAVAIGASGLNSCVSNTMRLAVNDVIRACDGNSMDATTQAIFTITQVHRF